MRIEEEDGCHFNLLLKVTFYEYTVLAKSRDTV